MVLASHTVLFSWMMLTSNVALVY